MLQTVTVSKHRIYKLKIRFISTINAGRALGKWLLTNKCINKCNRIKSRSRVCKVYEVWKCLNELNVVSKVFLNVRLSNSLMTSLRSSHWQSWWAGRTMPRVTHIRAALHRPRLLCLLVTRTVQDTADTRHASHVYRRSPTMQNPVARRHLREHRR